MLLGFATGWPMTALWQLTISRLREFYREPAAVFWVYGFPMLLAVVLGIAFQNRPVEVIDVDLVNSSALGDAGVDQLIGKLAIDQRVRITISSLENARQRLRTAKTGLVIIPTSEEPGWEYEIDPNRPECSLAKAAADSALLRASIPGLAMPVVRDQTEIGARYIDFLLPGLIGANIMGGGLWGIGFVIVDMRVRKLLKRFLASPMRRSDFLISLMLSRIFFLLVEILLLLIFGWLAFGIKIQGNILALGVLILLGGIAFAGVGLLVACRAKTIETVSGLMNMVMLPMYLTSGVFFSADRFPSSVQPVLQVLPLTVLNDGIRAIMNDGGGWSSILYPSVVLASWGSICFLLALRLFRWR
jgi:ABC-2 type transport system permease protein